MLEPEVRGRPRRRVGSRRRRGSGRCRPRATSAPSAAQREGRRTVAAPEVQHVAAGSRFRADDELLRRCCRMLPAIAVKSPFSQSAWLGFMGSPWWGVFGAAGYGRSVPVAVTRRRARRVTPGNGGRPVMRADCVANAYWSSAASVADAKRCGPDTCPPRQLQATGDLADRRVDNLEAICGPQTTIAARPRRLRARAIRPARAGAVSVSGRLRSAHCNGWRASPRPKSCARAPRGARRAGRRTAPIDKKVPRRAATPVHAILNYRYAILETDAILACHAAGLDPALGLMHTDTGYRGSLATDLMEPVRPLVDKRAGAPGAGERAAPGSYRKRAPCRAGCSARRAQGRIRRRRCGCRGRPIPFREGRTSAPCRSRSSAAGQTRPRQGI